MRIVSGHQSVYLPWLGLFHKLYLSDVFVYMDTVQYLEGDWNNRNKIRTPQGWMWLTAPIDRRASQGHMLDQIVLRGHEDPDAKTFWQKQHWSSIRVNYGKTPFFDDYATELEKMYLGQTWVRLVDLCWAQFNLFRSWLGLDDRRVVRMSEISFSGVKDELVLDHCRKLHGDAVVFGSHGCDYVNTKRFNQAGIQVYFQDYQHPVYRQRFPGFEPYMTILDLLFNYGPDSREVLLRDNISYKELQAGDLWFDAGVGE